MTSRQNSRRVASFSVRMMGVSHSPICRQGRMFISWILTLESFDRFGPPPLCRHISPLQKLHGETGRSRNRPEKRIEMKAFNALLRSSSGVCSRHVQRVAALGRCGMCSKVVDVFTFLHHVMFAGSIVSYWFCVYFISQLVLRINDTSCYCFFLH